MQPVERRLGATPKKEGGVDARRRASEECYRAIAELTSDFTYELRFEPGGTATVDCLAGRVMPVLGCTAEELDALGGLEALLHPEDQALYAEHQAALRQGKPNQAEYRVRTGSGELRWLQDRACPMQAERTEGAVWVLGTVQDVTQQKDIQEALRLTQASVDHAADAILWIDDRARFTYANDAACRMLGEAPEALLEKHLYDVDAGVSAAQWPEYRERLMSRGSTTTEAEYRRRDGQTLAVDVTTTYDEFNGQGFCFAFVRDASERKQNEAGLIRERREAEDMSRLKSAFLANMSHEIRTPLAAIIGFASILIDEVPEQHRRFIGFIERSGKRLLETLNSILNLSMLESGAVKLNREVVHVARDVLQQIDRLRPLAEEKAIALEAVLPGEDAQAFLDPVCLDRILFNLIGNAIKFTEKGGVTVTVGTHADQVAVAVQDTGIGIDPEFLPYLFSDFKQETMGEERSYEGIGLGLAITKHMVDLLEGSIQVETEKGVGSTFTVLLPRLSLKQREAVAAEKGPSHGADQPSGRPRLLAVEDNPEMLVLLKHYLASHFDVTTAPDLHTALEQGPPRRYDLVLMDVNLGDRGAGVEDLVGLRRVEAYRRTPAVAVTAYALPGDRERYTAAGFDAYLGRPFTRQQLFDILEPLLVGSTFTS